MNFKDLPKEYRERAEINHTKFDINNQYTEHMLFFDWHNTPEGTMFWAKCLLADNVTDLPKLPKLPKKTNDEVIEALNVVNSLCKYYKKEIEVRPEQKLFLKSLNILIGFVKEKIS